MLIFRRILFRAVTISDYKSIGNKSWITNFVANFPLLIDDMLLVSYKSTELITFF